MNAYKVIYVNKEHCTVQRLINASKPWVAARIAIKEGIEDGDFNNPDNLHVNVVLVQKNTTWKELRRKKP